MGDRLAVGLRTLTPPTQVRILVPQPSIEKAHLAWAFSIDLCGHMDESLRSTRVRQMDRAAIRMTGRERAGSVATERPSAANNPGPTMPSSLLQEGSGVLLSAMNNPAPTILTSPLWVGESSIPRIANHPDPTTAPLVDSCSIPIVATMRPYTLTVDPNNLSYAFPSIFSKIKRNTPSSSRCV